MDAREHVILYNPEQSSNSEDVSGQIHGFSDGNSNINIDEELDLQRNIV